jgi:hypothetical protein
MGRDYKSRGWNSGIAKVEGKKMGLEDANEILQIEVSRKDKEEKKKGRQGFAWDGMYDV